MSIIALIVWLVVIGVVAWLITTYIPMPQPFKTILMIVLVVVALLLVLSAFGLIGGLSTDVPRVR